jgi:hypothetical protein
VCGTQAPEARPVPRGKLLSRPGCVKGNQTREIVYIVTGLSVSDASQQQIADWLRGHWSVENKTHWVRDVTFDEDRHQTPRHQPAPTHRRHQHRQSPPTLLPGLQSIRRITPEQLK